MNVRSIIPKNFSSIEIILKNTASDWTIQTVKDCFNENYFNWVILRNEHIIGFVIVKNNIDSWEIVQIVIDQKYQQQGFAKQLLEHVIAQAKQEHIQKIQLEVRKINHPAISLYKNVGFVEVGLRKKYYTDGADALLFDLYC